MGALLLVILKGGSIADDLRAQSRIVVELHPDADKSDILRIQNALTDIDIIDPATIKHITKEEAWEEMYGDKRSADTELGANPFLDILLFGITPEHQDQSESDKVLSDISDMDGVSQVLADDSGAQMVSELVNPARWMILLVGLITVGLVVVLLYNLFRLRLMMSKRRIEIMELVGATDSFVRRPFLGDAARVGLISASVASALLLLLTAAINYGISAGVIIFPWLHSLLVCVILFIVVLAVALITTYILVNLYLSNLYKQS